MANFQIKFDIRILELEKENRWSDAADLAFRLWLANPDSLNCLLCAGTQIWYTLLVLDDIKDESLALGKIDLISDEQLKNNLMRVTRYGF